VSDCQASGNASSACVPHQIATKICPEMPRESKGKFRKMGKVHFKEQDWFLYTGENMYGWQIDQTLVSGLVNS
jgi:hypothetical protein